MKALFVVVVLVVQLLPQLASAEDLNREAVARLMATVAKEAALIGCQCGIESAGAIFVEHIAPDAAIAKTEECMRFGLEDNSLTYETAMDLINEAMDE
jgi:hypothetical protein